MLDRLDLCEDVTLVLRPQHWVGLDRFKALTVTFFPLMWGKGRVALEEQPAILEDAILEWIQTVSW